MRMYAIRDKNTGQYYAKRFKNSWYTDDLAAVRIYSDPERAERVIAKGDHHVSHPGNRDLEVAVLSLV